LVASCFENAPVPRGQRAREGYVKSMGERAVEIRETHSAFMDSDFRTGPRTKHAQEHFGSVGFEPKFPTLAIAAQMRGGSRRAALAQASHRVSQLG